MKRIEKSFLSSILLVTGVNSLIFVYPEFSQRENAVFHRRDAEVYPLLDCLKFLRRKNKKMNSKNYTSPN